MIGTVDDRGRALLEIEVRQVRDSKGARVTAWIDTAFDGHLVFPISLIEQLDLESLADTEAILADGSKVIMETFVCYLDWFGERMPLQVAANAGGLPLLGVGLLQGRVLHVDYAKKQLTLD